MDRWSMELQGRRILLVSPEAWGPAKLSKHHYAQALADMGASVHFLGPYRQGPWRVSELQKGLKLIEAPALPPGLRYMPPFIRSVMEARRSARLARLCGGPFDLLWNFDLYRFRWLTDRTYAGKRLLHVMDLPVPGVLGGPASLADGVVVLSPSMMEHLPPGAPPPLHVPHGIVERDPSEGAGPDLPPGIRVGCVGNMSIRYLDLEALLRAANAHPEITLYLIGPRTGNLGNTSPEREAPWERLISLPNVQWVGGVPSGSIPEWLAAMDLLLVAYDSGRFTVETAHPHKVMEYLQSGRPVLATFMRDMQAFNDQLIMLPCGVPVDAGIGDVLSRLPELLEPDRVQARRDSVRNLTYPAHVRRIIRYLDSVPMRP